MTRIGIDCRFANTQSGIGRYTRELVSGLKRRPDAHRFVFMDPNIPYYSLQEQLHMPAIIKREKIDLLHVPHFNIPLYSPVPVVTTIHDLTLHHFPNQASYLRQQAYKFLMHAAVMRSRHIITVSNYTADEIAKTYGEDVRKKMTMTYEGVSPEFTHAESDAITHVREKYNLYEKFILYVGAAKEHKNLQALIASVPQDSENIQLVLVTGGKELENLHLSPDVRILSDVRDDELPALYSAASCFVMPSLYEGFGLPILEAMACGTRVVASNSTSLPEICGNHAILVEPSVEGLSAGIKKALKGDSTPKAIRHAQSFSWEKMVEETVAIYENMVK